MERLAKSKSMIELDHKGPTGRLRVVAEDDWLRIMKTNKIGQTCVELHGLEIEMLHEVLKQYEVKARTR